MVREYRSEGLEGVIQAVRERDSTPGSLDFGLRARAGRGWQDGFPATRSPGLTILHRRPNDSGEKVRVLTVALPGGQTPMMDDDDEQIEVLDGVVLRAFTWAFAGVVVLGVAGGFALSRGVHRRLAAITGTAEATIDGARQTASGEWRGGEITGGRSYQLAPGDLLWISAGMPH